MESSTRFQKAPRNHPFCARVGWCRHTGPRAICTDGHHHTFMTASGAARGRDRCRCRFRPASGSVPPRNGGREGGREAVPAGWWSCTAPGARIRGLGCAGRDPEVFVSREGGGGSGRGRGGAAAGALSPKMANGGSGGRKGPALASGLRSRRLKACGPRGMPDPRPRPPQDVPPSPSAAASGA